MTRIPQSVKSTRQILHSDNHMLQSLLAQSRELMRIEAVISRYVDKNFSASSFKNNQLVLVTSSAAQATKLRYRQRNLLSALRRDGLHVNQIKIRVQPEIVADTVPAVERHLSQQNAEHLASSAEHITDAPLRNALLKLSKRAD